MSKNLNFISSSHKKKHEQEMNGSKKIIIFVLKQTNTKKIQFFSIFSINFY